MAGISLKNIKKVYPGGVEVINNLNLEIKTSLDNGKHTIE